jgi:plasmid replication initiation protein
MEMKILVMDELKNNNGLVCQSNKLIEARYNLTPNEQKLVIMMIALIHKDDKELKDYRIRVSEFSKLLDLKNKNIHSQVRELLCRLSNRSIFIEKGKHSFLALGWVSSAEYIAEKGIIELSFDKKLKPYLLELKREFTKLNLFTVVKFKSSYTIRIYMLLKQYEKIGWREFDLLDFREKLGAKTVYPKFKYFRANVINRAKKELDKKDKQGDFISDITFNFEPIKNGRSITRLRFIIIRNTPKKITPVVTHAESHLEQRNVLESSTTSNLLKNTAEFKAIRTLGVAERKTLSILEKYSTKVIQEKLELTAESMRKNPTGFFIKA